VIPVYNVQQPVQQSVSFSLEARIRYERMIARDERKGDVVVIGSLQTSDGCTWIHFGGSTYPGVCNAWGLHQNNLLEELDATYAHTRSGCVHSSQNIRFDASHELPLLRIAGVGDTGHKQV